ncbi:MAG: hypothetical protein ABS98_11645 [Lysobacteraceae bacterium SCN 69-48]|nr:MAG: hypothetical protein ABS98_11645 [Xanthomonadaceae bacterium SCN 69-48]
MTAFRVAPVSDQLLQPLHAPRLQERVWACSFSQVLDPDCPVGHAALAATHWVCELEPVQVSATQVLLVVVHPLVSVQPLHADHPDHAYDPVGAGQ